MMSDIMIFQGVVLLGTMVIAGFGYWTLTQMQYELRTLIKVLEDFQKRTGKE